MKITKIHVMHMYESCERHTFYVVITTEEGFTKSVEAHQTGSVYNDFAGLKLEEARDRSLIDAATWGDFLLLDPEPFVMDGKTHLPSMEFETYTMRRQG